jgi:hypothetical protein
MLMENAFVTEATPKGEDVTVFVQQTIGMLLAQEWATDDHLFTLIQNPTALSAQLQATVPLLQTLRSGWSRQEQRERLITWEADDSGHDLRATVEAQLAKCMKIEHWLELLEDTTGAPADAGQRERMQREVDEIGAADDMAVARRIDRLAVEAERGATWPDGELAPQLRVRLDIATAIQRLHALQPNNQQQFAARHEARIADAQEAMLRRMTEVGGLQLDLSAHKADKRASWTWDMCDKAARRLEQHCEHTKTDALLAAIEATRRQKQTGGRYMTPGDKKSGLSPTKASARLREQLIAAATLRVKIRVRPCIS